MRRLQTVVLVAALAVVGVLAGFVVGRSGRTNTSSGSSPRAITVTGTGTVSSVPTEADFTLGVSATANTASAATSANAAKMTRVIGALKSDGVLAADIQTGQLSLSPNENAAGTAVIDYTVTNSVTVDIHHLGKAGAVLDHAVAAGANQIDGPTLTPAGQQQLYRKALEAAIADAKTHAEAIAAAADEKLGALQSASETSNAPVTFGSSKAAIGAAASTPVEPGTAQTEADVTAAYAIAGG